MQHSTTPPSVSHASTPWSIMNRAPHTGDSPCRTPGCIAISRTPNAAIAVKKTSITGPNSPPTVPVP